MLLCVGAITPKEARKFLGCNPWCLASPAMQCCSLLTLTSVVAHWTAFLGAAASMRDQSPLAASFLLCRREARLLAQTWMVRPHELGWSFHLIGFALTSIHHSNSSHLANIGGFFVDFLVVSWTKLLKPEWTGEPVATMSNVPSNLKYEQIVLPSA